MGIHNILEDSGNQNQEYANTVTLNNYTEVK